MSLLNASYKQLTSVRDSDFYIGDLSGISSELGDPLFFARFEAWMTIWEQACMAETGALEEF